MSVRVVIAVFACTIIACAAAGVAIVHTATVANAERAALIQFVCAAVDIQQASGTPTGQEYARRFNEILVELGEDQCATQP